MSEPDKAAIAAEKEALNLKLPPIVHPPEDTGVDTATQSKLLNYRRSKEQQKTIHQLVIDGAKRSLDRTLDKRARSSPEPDYSPTMTSEIKKKGIAHCCRRIYETTLLLYQNIISKRVGLCVFYYYILSVWNNV